MECARVKHHCFAVDRESPASVTCVVCSPNSWWYGKKPAISRDFSLLEFCFDSCKGPDYVLENLGRERGSDFSLPQRVQTGFGATQSPVPWVLGRFPVVKAVGV